MKNMFTNTHKWIGFKIIVLLFAANIQLNAQNFQDTFTGSEITGALTTQTTAEVLETKDENPHTFISLKVKDDTAPYTSYKFSLTLQVTPIQPDGTLATESEDITLEVENNLSPGIANIIDIKQFKINNAYGANVVVLSNTFEDIENNISLVDNATVPDNIELTVGFNTERFYELPANAPTIEEHTVENINTELKINWSELTEARYYDVEWTWIDNYDSNGSALTESDILLSVKDFERNNTRIQTTNTTYSIPLIYAQGFIIYRVRAVGNFLEDLTKNKYTSWSINPVNPAPTDFTWNSTISNWKNGDKNVFLIDINTEHQANKNWQFQASYAEDGKKKEVVSYFDGSLRNRQTVTTINSDDNAIVGEVVYDAQGRPAVEILPVPTSENILKYYDNFNKSTHPDRATKSYSYLDFDKDLQNEIDTPSDDKKMNESDGASNYYAPSNTITSDYKNQIPNALKYPFSQIEYTPDNTGRIRRKGGVGATHQLGSKHEMEYYYGTPEQPELNRLFGYSVGNALHYKKNMVLDPNRQLSISYIDPQGRTIATALAGASPVNLEGLDDEKNEDLHETLTTDLLGKVTDGAKDTAEDNNQIGTSGIFGALQDQLTYNAVKTVVFDDVRTFTYNVTAPEFTFGCPVVDATSAYSQAYTLDYDLKIDILDEDGASLLPVPVIKPIVLNGTNIITLTDTELPDVTVNRGTFAINKTLVVNQDKVEEYADDYISRIQDPNDDCYVPKTNIIAPLEIEGGCNFTCEECESNLLGDFIDIETARNAYANEQIALNQDRYDSFTGSERLSFEASLKAQWDEALDTCRAPCADPNSSTGNPTPNIISCQTALDQLLKDMSPLGQYGNGENNTETILNIFDEANNKLLSAKIEANSTEYYSWKNPWHPDYDKSVTNTEGHYYNEDGSISYIKVKEIVTETTNDDGEVIETIITYQPAIEEGVTITLIEGTDDEYLVEPQFLTNNSDFTAIWEENWSYSLLSYHPEYDYLLYTNALCELQIGNFSSDGFDSYLQSISTYADAINPVNGLLTSTPSLSNPDIFNKDPYFKASQINDFETAALATARKQIMIEALTDNFDGAGELMMASAYSTIVCNSLETCPQLTSASNILNAVNSLTDISKQDQFWNTYKANYLGLKQRIQSVFINAYAQKNGLYNGCIGISEAPVALVANISTYSSSITSVLQNYLNGTSPSNGICNDAFADSYTTKKKRFLPTDLYYNAGADPKDVVTDIAEQVDYQYYVNSGTCPLARDLTMFLDGYFKDSALAGNTVLGSNRDYEGLYLSTTLFEEFGGVFPATTVTTNGNIGSSSQQLVLSINDGVLLSDSEVTVTLPTTYNWNNYNSGFTITEVSTITSSYNETTQEFQFSALAKLDVNGTYEEIVITGTTLARITCSVDNPVDEGQYLGSGNTYDETGACNRESYFSKAMKKLINSLIDSNQTDSASIDITNLDAYAKGYLPDFYEGGNEVTWAYLGANTYTIDIDGTQQFQMTLDSLMPNDVTITNISFEYIYNNDNTSIVGQSIKLTWLTDGLAKGSTQGSVIQSETKLLNFLCCDDVNNYKELSETNSYNYVFKSKSISTTNEPVGHTWSEDGTILYLSFHNDKGRQYICSTPFDVSTATLNGSASIFGQGEGIHITSSGNYMIHKFRDIRGDIRLYELSTPHDVSTMSEVSRVNLSEIARDADVFMTDDGLNMYLFKAEGLTRYSLSVPFDLSNPTQEEILINESGVSFTFSKDLKELLILKGSSLRTYSLTTSGDLSTASLVNEQPLDNAVGGSFARIRMSPDTNYLTVSTYRNDFPLYTLEKPNINKFKPAFLIEKIVTGTGGEFNTPSGKFYAEQVYFVPNGFAIPLGELVNFDISLNFNSYSQDPSTYTGAQITVNGKVFNQANNNLTGGYINYFVGGIPDAPRNRISWNESLAYPATFDIFNFSYSFNNIGRTFNLDEGTGSTSSTDGNGIFTPSSSSWFTDSTVGNGLKFSPSLEAVWDDSIPFIFEQGVDINFSANMRFQDVLPYDTAAEGYGLVAQFDYIDPNNTNTMYSFKVYGDRGDENVNTTPTPCNNTDPTICIPQPITPVSCTDKYTTYVNILNALGYDTTLAENDANRDPQFYTEKDFCDKQLAYITDDYIDYITSLVLSDQDPIVVADPTMSINYMTIATFGSTDFGYGYDPNPEDSINGMALIIDDYAEHVFTDNAITPDNIKTWAQFTSDYLYELTSSGTNCISLPAQLPITTEEYTIDLPVATPCEQLTTAIYNSYSDDVYKDFLKREREDFINAYLKHATEEVIENFDMTYFDKEYQYTLYYYDQAGNLSQTVPPEGVNRFTKNQLDAVADVNGESLSLDNRINIHRNENKPLENTALLPQHDYKTQYAYNSLNQLVWQFTPDGGETRFAYDALGRIIASQNAKQLENNTFSYTTYDELGRIVEAGELVPNTSIAINQTKGKLVDASGNSIFTDGFTNDDNPVPFPKNVSAQQNEVTRTKYAKYLIDPTQVFKTYDANNLVATSRNRVTEIYYFDTVTPSTSSIDFDNAMYYNYDIHGNVKELVHNNKLLAKSAMQYSGLKHVEYEYDLISGNVNKVFYQKDAPDQFTHQYTYDADNRIIAVQTTSDGVIWEEDANYKYYPHGPLARTELGDKKVQGQDYAYTIQGWLKGVNTDQLDETNDLGNDGNTGSTVAKDAYGFALTYNEDDYTPIGTINAFVNSNASGPNSTQDLFNGNIKQMVTDVMNTNEAVLGSQINQYGYDQLNRIKSMQGYNASGTANYYADYKYDKNGNLQTLNRKADLGQAMDQLSYNYENTNTNPLTGEVTKNNQLNYVTDAIGDAGLKDLDTQLANNYEYDDIGQLISDNAEGINTINWRVDGKVASIIKADNTEIHFKYDGLGNRISKTVLPENKTTVYSRDAQGNVLAVYETNEADITNITTNKFVGLKEHHIYGSSRLGIEQKNITIPEDGDTAIVQENLVLTTDNILTSQILQAEHNIDVAGNSNTFVVGNTGNLTLQAGNQIILKPGFKAVSGANFKAQIQQITATLPENTYAHSVGDKRYELSNHLGNVLAVVSDRKLVDDPLNFTNFTADVLTYNDYYPGGMLLPNRHGNSSDYSYGFNGMENDNEIKGEGNTQDHLFRSYDVRLMRYKSLDPLAKQFPALSPYQFAGNNPIAAIDLEGLEPATVNPNTETLVFVLQGYGGNPPDNNTQAQNAGGGLGVDMQGLGKISKAAAGKPKIQVVTFASSSSDNTKNDVKKTILDFKKQNANGKVIIVGHSGGGDNAIELAKENPGLIFDLIITLDTQDPKPYGIDDNNINSNVKNVINYFQIEEGIGGETVDFDSNNTNGANIVSPGSNHRSIDNDQVGNVIKDINNLIQGKDAVGIAKKRKQKVNDPAKSGSPDIGGVPGSIKDVVNPKSSRQ